MGHLGHQVKTFIWRVIQGRKPARKQGLGERPACHVRRTAGRSCRWFGPIRDCRKARIFMWLGLPMRSKSSTCRKRLPIVQAV